jgi:hypothetical protein
MIFNPRVAVFGILFSMLVVGAPRFTAEQQSSRPSGVVVVKAADVKWEDYPALCHDTDGDGRPDPWDRSLGIDARQVSMDYRVLACINGI